MSKLGQRSFDKINNIVASYNLIITNDRLDGAAVAHSLGTPGQTKVSGDRQRETTHEICCLAAECSTCMSKVSIIFIGQFAAA